MKTKRTIQIRTNDGFIKVEVDALSLRDVSATIGLCQDHATNFRAMELCRKIAETRAKEPPMAVYVIAPENIPVCKIGIANDPHDRLIGIQNGNWNRLSIVALLWADTASYEIEQLALKAAKQMGIHLRGEWIAASPQEACELVIKAARHSKKPVYDSATWLDNWPIRLHAVAEARGRATVIGKLKPLRKFSN